MSTTFLVAAAQRARDLAGVSSDDTQPSLPTGRDALGVCLGACVPNAMIPDVPPPLEVTDSLLQSPMIAPEPDAGRIFCVSDLHADHPANMDWCRGLRSRGDYFKRDVLIVAGDVTSSHAILTETLEILTATFAKVFYTPGCGAPARHPPGVRTRNMGPDVHARCCSTHQCRLRSLVWAATTTCGPRAVSREACTSGPSPSTP